VEKVRTFNHNYPSDITREQYEVVREELEYTKIRTKPRATAYVAPVRFLM